MVGWIAVGFGPTYGVLTIVNRKLTAIKYSLMAPLGGD